MNIDYAQVRRARLCYVGFNAVFALAIAGTMATYAQFLLSKGFGYFESNLINSTFFITCLCLEIPTGVFADVKGRRNAFIASNICFSISLIAYYFATNMTSCIMVEIIAAFARTLATGAFDSWLCSKLIELGLKGQELDTERDKATNLDHIIRPLLSIVGTILGAWLSSFNAGLPFLATGILMLVNGCLVLAYVPESFAYQAKQTNNFGYTHIVSIARSGIRYACCSRQIRFSFLLWTSLTFCVQSLNMQWQPYFKPLVGGETKVGLLGGGIFMSLAIGGVLRKKVRTEATSMTIVLLIIAVCICATACVTLPTSIILWFLMHEAGRGLLLPLRTSYVHRHAREEDRTTIRSVESMSNHVGAALGLLGSGIIVENIGIKSTWMYAGLLLVILACILYLIRPKS